MSQFGTWLTLNWVPFCITKSVSLSSTSRYHALTFHALQKIVLAHKTLQPQPPCKAFPCSSCTLWHTPKSEHGQQWLSGAAEAQGEGNPTASWPLLQLHWVHCTKEDTATFFILPVTSLLKRSLSLPGCLPVDKEMSLEVQLTDCCTKAVYLLTVSGMQH